MVQLPEPCSENLDLQNDGFETIADIGKERIRRAASKVEDEYLSFKGDLGFKVFKLDSSNIEAWDSNIENFEDSVLNAANVLKDDRSELDIVYELFLKYGLDLSYPVNTHEVADKQVYEIGAGSLFICLEDGITIDFVEGLIKLYESFDDEAAPRVVFKDSGFKTDAAKKDAESTLKDAGILDVKCL
jgi:adenine-specific DNA-methyltransferase